MMVEGGVPAAQGQVEVGLEAVAVAVDDPLLEPPLDRPAAPVLLAGRRRRDTPSKMAEQLAAAGRSPRADGHR